MAGARLEKVGTIFARCVILIIENKRGNIYDVLLMLLFFSLPIAV